MSETARPAKTWILSRDGEGAQRVLSPDSPGEGWTEWKGKGTPGAAAPAVPEVITNAQGQAALRLAILPDGSSRRTAAEKAIRDGVAATRALAESDPKRIRADLALIGWEQTNEWRRAGATIAAIAGQLGWSDADVDALFVAGAGIDL